MSPATHSTAGLRAGGRLPVAPARGVNTRRQVVEDYDEVPVRHELIAEMRADEAGASRDEHFPLHKRILPGWSDPYERVKACLTRPEIPLERLPGMGWLNRTLSTRCARSRIANPDRYFG